MQLDPARPIMVLDTSALVELAIHHHRPGSGYTKRFHDVAVERWGGDVQIVFHPVTLAELASNTHEEVLHSKRGRPRSAEALRKVAQANTYALIALKGYLEDQETERWFQALPLVPSWSDWAQLANDRADFRHLRCSQNSGVVPLATMVDHMILNTAISLRSNGYTVAFTSGDNELLGAAERLGIPILYTHDLRATKTFPWKRCEEDASCVAACSDGVADCQGMFV